MCHVSIMLCDYRNGLAQGHLLFGLSFSPAFGANFCSTPLSRLAESSQKALASGMATATAPRSSHVGRGKRQWVSGLSLSPSDHIRAWSMRGMLCVGVALKVYTAAVRLWKLDAM